jgi:hypothetical protein
MRPWIAMGSIPMPETKKKKKERKTEIQNKVKNFVIMTAVPDYSAC